MSALSEKILAIATNFLGVGARKFLDRQARHLNLDNYEMIGEEHLEQFAWWVGVSSKFLLDPRRAAEFTLQIRRLAGTDRRGKLAN